MTHNHNQRAPSGTTMMMIHKKWYFIILIFVHSDSWFLNNKIVRWDACCVLLALVFCGFNSSVCCHCGCHHGIFRIQYIKLVIYSLMKTIKKKLASFLTLFCFALLCFALLQTAGCWHRLLKKSSLFVHCALCIFPFIFCCTLCSRQDDSFISRRRCFCCYYFPVLSHSVSRVPSITLFRWIELFTKSPNYTHIKCISNGIFFNVKLIIVVFVVWHE